MESVAPQIKASQKRKSLTDIASDCLVLILQLRSTNNYGNANNIKAKVNEMFELFEREARNAGFENEKIQQAKFALVAFLDETIMSSSWDQKDEWLAEPLQLKLFDTFNAGDEFFNNIKTLRQRTSVNKDALEVYYFCLVLGFKGKYQLQSPENLRRVIDDLSMELYPDMYSSTDALSPNGKPQDTIIQAVKSTIPIWIYPVAAVIIFIILYWLMSSSISGKAEEVIGALSRLVS